MALPEPRSAAREPTAAVSVVQSAPQCGRDRARPRGNLHHAPIATVVHHHTARVTRRAPGRFRANACAGLERRLARGVEVRQHRSVVMDYDLLALAPRAGVDDVAQGGLAE